VQLDANAPSVERIIEHVGTHFHVTPRDLRSPRRSRAVVVPRQVAMFLARRLTRLSSAQIAASFGKRDHTTVLHACRKIEAAVKTDPVLQGAVDQLQTALR
jgi:chromosomal replication initiator protein